MKRLEDMLAEKMSGLARYIISKLVKPDIEVGSVIELDEQAIEKLKSEYGIEGIIIDVDETLRRDMKMIPPCNQEWLEKLRGQLKVVILSNGMDKNMETFFSERGIDYIQFALKPLKRNFKKACKIMDLPEEKVLVVGDDLWDDIHGGRRNKMKTVRVKDVEEDER